MVSDNNLFKKLEKASHLLAYIGDVSLFAMMCLTVVDVVGRYVFNKPVLGAFEITEFLMLIIIASYLAFAQAGKSHITVDILVSRFSQKAQAVIGRINHIISFFMISGIAVMCIVKGLELKDVSEASQLLKVPNYPFAFFLVLGFAVLCLEYVLDIIKSFKMVRSNSENES
jgi:TRAP-type C4-dicarboxylate transport system permease small subunit